MSITINGTTNTISASGTVTVPALTLGGAITGNGQNVSGLGTLGCVGITSSGSITGTSLSAGTGALTAGSGTFSDLVTNSAAGVSSFGTLKVNGTTYGYVGVSGLNDGLVTGSTLGDLVVRAENNDIRLSVDAGASSVAVVSPTGLAVTGTLSASSHILPTIDNTSNLGSAALGMKELFCDNGTINTSDARRKTEVSALSAAEINAAKQLAKEIGSFKFLAAVTEKGDAARLHIGMTVQRAIEIMESNGLNPIAYSFICHDAWDQQVVEHPAVEAKDAALDDEGNVVEPAVEAKDAWTEVTLEAGDKYSFRAHELLLFMAAGFEARLSALEAA